MRDLFSGCAYVHTYVRVSHAIDNRPTEVYNLWSRLGMSICDHARNVNLCSCLGTQVSLIRALHENIDGQCFLAMKDREDSAAFATYLVELSAETSAERSRWLETLRKKKQRGQSTIRCCCVGPAYSYVMPRFQLRNTRTHAELLSEGRFNRIVWSWQKVQETFYSGLHKWQMHNIQ